MHERTVQYRKRERDARVTLAIEPKRRQVALRVDVEGQRVTARLWLDQLEVLQDDHFQVFLREYLEDYRGEIRYPGERHEQRLARVASIDPKGQLTASVERTRPRPSEDAA